MLLSDDMSRKYISAMSADNCIDPSSGTGGIILYLMGITV
jgi:hypothetical protein